jgi:hypothetical protein
MMDTITNEVNLTIRSFSKARFREMKLNNEGKPVVMMQ